MVIYEDIARLAAEIGRTPDFVINVCFWITLILGAVLQSFIVLLLRHLLKARR